MKQLPRWYESPISKTHDRDQFDCGDFEFNKFLKLYARKSHAHGGAKTFVALPYEDPQSIMGFYSLNVASIDYHRVPEIITRSLGRYEVPVFRLARLAVDKDFQKKGLGRRLLLAAGRRCLYASYEVGGVALLIDAKNHDIATWYISYGAMPLLDTPLSLVLPLKTIGDALQSAESTP